MTGLPEWARAHGPALFSAHIRSCPDDFVVNELLDIELSGDGEHDWLWIEKTGANTAWVADQLAQHASVPSRDVGYAGLKDRHAVTRQWFSVRRTTGEGTAWNAFDIANVNVLEAKRHARKLKRGAHRGNAFRIALRGQLPETDEIGKRLARIGASGVPNYFGEQRFGRDGSNIELGRAVIAGRRVSRNKRSIGISAVRSLAFNDALSQRVEDATWNTLLPGDTANLDGSNSVFAVDAVDREVEARCRDMDIHPTGELPAIDALGVKASRRALRMPVNELTWEFGDGVVWLGFTLPRGGFATAVLREIARW